MEHAGILASILGQSRHCESEYEHGRDYAIRNSIERFIAWVSFIFFWIFAIAPGRAPMLESAEFRTATGFELVS